MSEKDIVRELVQLMLKYPCKVLILDRTGDICYYADSDGNIFESFTEGYPRVHDGCDGCPMLTIDEAIERLFAMGQDYMFRIGICRLTPPFEEGVDWFT